jgi:hypothetical protein
MPPPPGPAPSPSAIPTAASARATTAPSTSPAPSSAAAPTKTSPSAPAPEPTSAPSSYQDPNNFTGNISIVRGNLKLGAANTLPATAIIDVGSANIADNTSFDLDGFPQTLAGLRRSSTNTTQVSTVTNSSATPATLTLNQSTTLAYSGRITGNLTLAKSGTGTLTLTRAMPSPPPFT